MKRGYILLIKSKIDPIGWLIRKYLGFSYNHVAWVLYDKEIIELSGNEIKILKLKNISKHNLNKALNYALKIQTNNNYYKRISNYLKRYYFKKYRISQLTCSSLIALCLDLVNYKFNNNPWYEITPKDIGNSDKVITVSDKKKGG